MSRRIRLVSLVSLLFSRWASRVPDEYNKPIRSFEDELRPDFNPADFRKSVCEYYREKMRFERTFEELAVKRNLAARKDGKVVYKNAAILLFAEDPTQYIPNASVRYVR